MQELKFKVDDIDLKNIHSVFNSEIIRHHIIFVEATQDEHSTVKQLLYLAGNILYFERLRNTILSVDHFTFSDAACEYIDSMGKET